MIVRLAETLPDDLYRIELYGIDDTLQGITALRNTRGEAFGDLTDDRVDNGTNQVVGFSLELAPQVLAVVPQPITRVPNPANPSNTILQQARNQIVVYFNDDDLFIEDDATGKPTQRSAENPEFYRLIFTQDSVKNTDDITFFPTSVQYDPAADTATLDVCRRPGHAADPGGLPRRRNSDRSRYVASAGGNRRSVAAAAADACGPRSKPQRISAPAERSRFRLPPQATLARR